METDSYHTCWNRRLLEHLTRNWAERYQDLGWASIWEPNWKCKKKTHWPRRNRTYWSLLMQIWERMHLKSTHWHFKANFYHFFKTLLCVVTLLVVLLINLLLTCETASKNLATTWKTINEKEKRKNTTIHKKKWRNNYKIRIVKTYSTLDEICVRSTQFCVCIP